MTLPLSCLFAPGVMGPLITHWVSLAPSDLGPISGAHLRTDISKTLQLSTVSPQTVLCEWSSVGLTRGRYPPALSPGPSAQLGPMLHGAGQGSVGLCLMVSLSLSFAASNTAPSVFPLTSCTGKVTPPQVTFGCLAKGYFPEPVTVTWSPNIGSSGVRTYPSVLQPSSGLYSLSSQATVSASSWKSNTYSCTVEHRPTSSSISKEISSRDGAAWPGGVGEGGVSLRSDPGIYLLRPHNEELSNSEDSVSLTCLVQGFFPEDISVQWMKNHKPDESLEYITTQSNKDGASNSNFFLYSKLTASKSSWNSGDNYTCMVIHEALQMKFTQRSVSKISGK
uniref:Ig-like domain-containing protein n=1 Tax=Chelonoidis abingdonii TaxID=106734 RepID=A0A8C0J4Z7_CHEAB